MMYSPIIPYAGFTKFTPALPEFYWNVYSAEQRIKHICYEICKLVHYADMLGDSINELSDEVDAKLRAIRAETDLKNAQLRDEIMHLLETLQIGQLQWDCQRGSYQDTVTAQRDMFNDVTVHSYSVGQLESVFDDIGMTVDGLANSGINVKGFAVMNHYLKMPSGLTDDLIPIG